MASVEGRDRLVELTNEKLASLRASIDQLHQALEQTRADAAAAQERNAEKNASWREIDRKLRARVEELEGALRTSQEKMTASRAENDDTRRRLKESEVKREHLIKVTKRLQERCEALLARLGDEPHAEQASEDETTLG